MPADPTMMDGAAKLAAVPSDPSLCRQTTTDACYGWRDNDGVHVPIGATELSDLTTGFTLLFTTNRPKMTMIGLTVPLDDSATP
jgi:hypothetical protein